MAYLLIIQVLLSIYFKNYKRSMPVYELETITRHTQQFQYPEAQNQQCQCSKYSLNKMPPSVQTRPYAPTKNSILIIIFFKLKPYN